MMLLLCACPFHRHCAKLLFSTTNNLELLDMLSGQYRLGIGRRGRLCSSVSSPFGEQSTTNRFQKKCQSDVPPLGGGGFARGGGECASSVRTLAICVVTATLEGTAARCTHSALRAVAHTKCYKCPAAVSKAARPPREYNDHHGEAARSPSGEATPAASWRSSLQPAPDHPFRTPS